MTTKASVFTINEFAEGAMKVLNCVSRGTFLTLKSSRFNITLEGVTVTSNGIPGALSPLITLAPAFVNEQNETTTFLSFFNATDSIFRDRTLNYLGGLIQVDVPPLLRFTVQFYNVTISDARQNGAVCVGPPESAPPRPHLRINFTRTTFQDSSSFRDGGALYAKYGTFYLNQVVIKSCSSNLHGGGIALFGSSRAIIHTVQFSNVFAKNDGGGIVTWDDAVVQAFNITATNVAGQFQGGLFAAVLNSSISADRITCENITGMNGGLAASWNYGRIVLTNVVAINSSATRDGGLISVKDNAKLSVVNATVYSTFAMRQGGLFIAAQNANFFGENIFVYDSKSNDEGGAVYVEDAHNVTLRNVSLVSSSSNTVGGVLAVLNGSIDMQCNPRTVMSARCAGPWGGCVYIETNRYQSKIIIQDCNFLRDMRSEITSI